VLPKGPGKERQLIGGLSPKTKDKNIEKSLWSISTPTRMPKRINNFSYDLDSPSLFSSSKFLLHPRVVQLIFRKNFRLIFFAFFVRRFSVMSLEYDRLFFL
jgi:hypothetical protein